MSEDALAILQAQETLQIAGRAVTVRELTFGQSLALHGDIAPVIAALLPRYDSAEGIDSEHIIDAMAVWPDLALRLLALTTGESADWLQALSEREGYLVLLHFARVNAPFFVTRLEMALQTARARRDRMATIPAPSLPALSATDTAPMH